MSEQNSTAGQKRTVVVDLGKKSRKQLKRLRRGEGKLMEKLDALIDEMRSSNQISAGAETVVVVVEKKARKSPINLFNK
jgi:hypothetical protein